MTATYYSVQNLDNGIPKLVPHNEKGDCEFLNRKKATDFLEKLKIKNPDEKFRILTRKETFKPESWI